MITMLIIRNTTPILSRKGNWGVRYFNNAESGILIAEAMRTEFEVVRFQNNPKKNRANIAGLMNPVYS